MPTSFPDDSDYSDSDARIGTPRCGSPDLYPTTKKMLCELRIFTIDKLVATF